MNNLFDAPEYKDVREKLQRKRWHGWGNSGIQGWIIRN
jgi:hypothetical protein